MRDKRNQNHLNCNAQSYPDVGKELTKAEYEIEGIMSSLKVRS